MLTTSFISKDIAKIYIQIEKNPQDFFLREVLADIYFGLGEYRIGDSYLWLTERKHIPSKLSIYGINLFPVYYYTWRYWKPDVYPEDIGLKLFTLLQPGPTPFEEAYFDNKFDRLQWQMSTRTTYRRYATYRDAEEALVLAQSQLSGKS